MPLAPDLVSESSPDLSLLRAAASRPPSERLRVYFRLSGPGWLQSAITLGGGSLSGSLYLGVLGGYELMWLQPLAMIFGIIMLSAIGYVTMCTGKRPFHALNVYVNPVLGYGWAIASLVASMVWAMPQYSLSIGVIQQNLLPGLLGAEGPFGALGGKLVPTLLIFAFSVYITWNYGKGGRGVRLYEATLKIMVGVIVLCFGAVVLRIAFSAPGLDWNGIARGFLPDVSLLTAPAEALRPYIEATPWEHRGYWVNLIVGNQRDVIVTAAATAVGINMTFLFPYTLLRRKWSKQFVGLSRFDLGVGMLVPFTLATSFVVIAAASQFHGVPQTGLGGVAGSEPSVAISPRMMADYGNLIAGLGREVKVTDADRQLAAMLVPRDAFQLADALRPLTGELFGRIVFGLGVLGMTLSSITLLMLISGMVVCELLGREQTGWTFRLGSLAAGSGVLGPFIWTGAAFWLAVPTSIFAFILLPIAYLAFFLMMNQPSLLGVDLPKGGARFVWNGLMGIVLIIVTGASALMLYDKGGRWGIMVAAGFGATAAGVSIWRRRRA